MAANNYDITDLLTTKSFEELTEEEQNYVVNELGSEMAYHEMYQVVQGTADYEAPKITSKKRDKTFAAFDELHTKEPAKKRGVIWLRPLAIGLAAASIIGFLWLIVFNDLDENQTFAENKTPNKQVQTDTVSANESQNKKGEQEIKQKLEATESPESEPNFQNFKEEKTLENKESTIAPIPATLDEKVIVAEKSNNIQPAQSQDAEIADEDIDELRERELEEEAKEGNDYANNQRDENSLGNNVAAQPAMNEYLSASRSAKNNADASTINMNSNISKQTIFKVKLPLTNHYTAY